MPSQHLGKPVTVRLDPADIDLLKELGAKHGGQKGAILAGLRLLAGANDIDLSAALRRAADILESQAKPAARPASPPPAKPAAAPPPPRLTAAPKPPQSKADAKARAASRFAKKPTNTATSE